MAFDTSSGEERARRRSRLGGLALARGWRLCGRAAAQAYWPLLILFIGLQIADVVTTNYALALPGNWEANPIMRLSQTHFGAAWWLPKLGAVGFAAAVATRSRPLWPMLLAVSYYAVIVTGNLACL